MRKLVLMGISLLMLFGALVLYWGSGFRPKTRHRHLRPRSKHSGTPMRILNASAPDYDNLPSDVQSLLFSTRSFR